MAERLVFEKSNRFAIRILKMYKYLTEEKREHIISKQVLRSGTSIGANLAEAEYAVSPADFLNKNSIALKECSETLYWLNLLKEAGFLDENAAQSIMSDCEELLRMLISIVKTLKSSK